MSALDSTHLQPGNDRTWQGSVRAVRTFKITSDGHLAPVTHRAPWAPGSNTARCYPDTLQRLVRWIRGSADEHTAPASGCACGMWGFGSLQALRDSPYSQQHQIIAVISCHGTLIPGELGVRAQHASIQALWLSARVADRTCAQIARTYPAAAIYRSLDAMLAEHSLTALPTYHLPPIPTRAQTLAPVLVTVIGAIVATVAVTTMAIYGPGSPVPVTSITGAMVNAPLLAALPGVVIGVMRPRAWRAQVLVLALQAALVAVGAMLLGPWTLFMLLFDVLGATWACAVCCWLRAYRQLHPQPRPRCWTRARRSWLSTLSWSFRRR